MCYRMHGNCRINRIFHLYGNLLIITLYLYKGIIYEEKSISQQVNVLNRTADQINVYILFILHVYFVCL